jgi:hypothetical protein
VRVSGKKIGVRIRTSCSPPSKYDHISPLYSLLHSLFVNVAAPSDTMTSLPDIARGRTSIEGELLGLGRKKKGEGRWVKSTP